MQKIYESPKAKYTWNFPKLDITYFEIPKTGSSSVKTVLFRTNYNLDYSDELNIGGGKLAQRFPDSVVKNFQERDFSGRILIIYRDPIARLKSAYRSIFIGRQKMSGNLSEYFSTYFQTYIQSPASNGLLNHHKPMSWFFPQELLQSARVKFVNTNELNNFSSIMGFDIAPTKKDDTSMPHLLNVNKSLGDIDMSDDEIRAALGAEFDDDFKLFDTLNR